ncbi:Aerotolerance protein BatA [hydrothermal vent metagenome]|uniref:Aerotolerance protein BatA n=1 Tax=hydrothermal vent metagenome TaxID=652676 RepID=A0A3B0ZS45_9ZZZZ
MIDFIWPWAAAFLPLPLLVRFLLPAKNTMQDAALYVPFINDFDAISHSQENINKNIFIIIMATFAWCLLILAVMRPQWLGEPIALPVSGRDLMMAVDLSGSMQAEDFRVNGRTVNRLQATKYVASEFIKQRKGDRLGLILFGEQAYLQTPLTFDHKTVNTLLQEAQIGLAGKATAIGDAIGLATKRLIAIPTKNNQPQSRVLILLTDGANTAGEITPLKAAELAAQNGLKIYTIGIGADEMIRYSFFGAQRVNPSADLDEKTLTAIAEKTGGKYFRARDTKQLSQIYNLLNKLEPTEKESQHFRPVSALYVWPLAAAFIIALLISLIKLTAGLSFISLFKHKQQQN